jgi:hypothetical protein
MTEHQDRVDLAGRLERIESQLSIQSRQLNGWRRTAQFALGGLAVVLLGAAAEKTTLDRVETRELALVDAEGRLRATLAVRPDGSPGFALLDSDQTVRLSLDLASDGRSSMNLHDSAGTTRSALSIRDNGTPGLGMFDSRAVLRASIDLGTDASGGMHLFDEQGVIRSAMAIRGDGSPGFGLFDGEGVVRKSFELGNEEQPSEIASPE